MVTVAYNAYCAISMEGDDDTCDGKTAGSRSWEVEAAVISLVGTLFHVIITRMGTDLIFLSRLGSTICFTNFGSHDPIVLFWNPWYTEPCYKGSLLYINYRTPEAWLKFGHATLNSPLFPALWCVHPFLCMCRKLLIRLSPNLVGQFIAGLPWPDELLVMLRWILALIPPLPWLLI